MTRSMKIILSLVPLFITLHLCAQGPFDNGIDVRHYDFQLELYDSTDVISGTADIQILFRKDLSSIELDLVGKNSNGKGMAVSGITLNGKSLQFGHQHEKLKITTATTIKAGQIETFSITYKGIPADGLIIAKNKFGDRTFFGDNWPNRAHNWLPTIDHPSDKASVDFIVMAPAAYQVIGNGIKVEESYLSKSRKITHWKEEVDIPTKVMVIGAAHFATHLEGDVNGVPVESWVFPQNRLDGFHDYAVAVPVLQYLENRIGPYPYKKLANVQSITRFGGMENASNIFYFENSVNGKADQEVLIAHEIAHQWFGNSASEIDWPHIWLSEGFATYLSRTYTEFARGKESMDAALQTDRHDAIEFYKTKPLPIVFTSVPKDLFELLNVNSYDKACWGLHMLRNEIGDDAFWKGIRKYYRTYQYRNAVTADFKVIMEEVSNQDLDVFFGQWLFRAGHPVLDVSWTYDTKTKMINGTINQTQEGQPFDITVELGIYSSGSTQPAIERLKVNQPTNKFSIPAATKPTQVVLDPNTILLFEEKIKK